MGHIDKKQPKTYSYAHEMYRLNLKEIAGTKKEDWIEIKEKIEFFINYWSKTKPI